MNERPIVSPSRGVSVAREPIDSPPLTGPALTPGPASHIIVIDRGTEKAIVCRKVIAYDGVDIYRMVPGQYFENHEDAIALVVAIRRKSKG